MFFEHGYFIPLKEIILEDTKSPWISRFEQYVSKKYPDFLKNPYIRQNLSKKDRIMLVPYEKALVLGYEPFIGSQKKKGQYEEIGEIQWRKF